MLLMSTQLRRRLVIWPSSLTIEMALCWHGFQLALVQASPTSSAEKWWPLGGDQAVWFSAVKKPRLPPHWL